LIQRGIDPKEHEASGRLDEQRRRGSTFAAVAEDFISQHLKGQRRAGPSEREIRRELISRWTEKQITGLSRPDVVEMVDAIRDRGANRQAHNILGHARTIYNWAIDRGIYGLEQNQSPFNRLRPSRLIGPKKTRKRILTDEELCAFWRASHELGYPYGPLFRFLLLTGQRKAEVGEMRWHEIDMHRRVWTIPPERFKSDETHTVPLSDLALALLECLAQFAQGDFVFSTTSGRKPVNGFSKAKARLDAASACQRIRPDLPRWVENSISV